MIELIFAIIVISIVVISMPMMMKVNEDAVEGNIVQEALFASSAKMMQVLSYPWDENSTDNTGVYGKVIDIPGGTAAYKRSDANGTLDVNSSYRVGHILQDNHRRFHDYTSPYANTIGALATNVATPTALNNTGQTNIPFDNPLPSATGYKNDYTMDVDVSYISDTVASPFIFASSGNNTPTNMKLITVTIKDKNGNPLTLLRSYSANIGEFDFAKRRF
jgi:hypothetical protein